MKDQIMATDEGTYYTMVLEFGGGERLFKVQLNYGELNDSIL